MFAHTGVQGGARTLSSLSVCRAPGSWLPSASVLPSQALLCLGVQEGKHNVSRFGHKQDFHGTTMGRWCQVKLLYAVDSTVRDPKGRVSSLSEDCLKRDREWWIGLWGLRGCGVCHELSQQGGRDESRADRRSW